MKIISMKKRTLNDRPFGFYGRGRVFVKKIFGTWQGHKCQDPVKAGTARKSERAKEIEGER